MWKVEVKENVSKFLKKQSRDVRERFDKIVFEKFKDKPYPKAKKHILEVNKQGDYLCEFAINKFRFYYEIRAGVVVIEEVEYLGKVTVLEGHGNHKSGNKNYSHPQKSF